MDEPLPCSRLTSAFARKPPKAKNDDLSAWRVKGGNFQGTQHPSLTQIDKRNVSDLNWHGNINP